MWMKLAIAGLMATASVCTAQSELPDSSADARKLRDLALAWSQGVDLDDHGKVDEVHIEALSDFLEGQRWPDPLAHKRWSVQWMPVHEQRKYAELGIALEWLDKAFVAERPAYQEQLEAIDWKWWGAKAIHELDRDTEVDRSLIELDRWSAEWERLLVKSEFRATVVDFGDGFSAWVVPEPAVVDRDVLRCLLWWIRLELTRGEWDRAMEIARAYLVYARTAMVTVGAIGVNDAFCRFAGISADGALIDSVAPFLPALDEPRLAMMSGLAEQLAAEHYLVPVLSRHAERLNMWEQTTDPKWFQFEFLPENLVARMMEVRMPAKQALIDITDAELELRRAILTGDHDTLERTRTYLDQWSLKNTPLGMAEFDATEKELNRSDPFPSLMGILAFWNGDADISPFRTGLARSRAFKLSIALHRHKLAHGKFPESLELLVPQFLDRLPMDPFDPDRGTLRYRFDSDGFTLWSVGPDGEDNHGEADPERPHDPGEEFDLILWPTD